MIPDKTSLVHQRRGEEMPQLLLLESSAALRTMLRWQIATPDTILTEVGDASAAITYLLYYRTPAYHPHRQFSPRLASWYEHRIFSCSSVTDAHSPCHPSFVNVGGYASSCGAGMDSTLACHCHQKTYRSLSLTASHGDTDGTTCHICFT